MVNRTIRLSYKLAEQPDRVSLGAIGKKRADKVFAVVEEYETLHALLENPNKDLRTKTLKLKQAEPKIYG
ncbi:MAG: hypothetical protein MK110_04785 [Fuerstiella sp.]|nr:hypothetical protein [Fuerstiella sp.]